MAATLLALFVALWGWIDYQNPGRYITLFLFSCTEEKNFDELTAVSHKDGKETKAHYRLRKSPQGIAEYSGVVPPYRPIPSHPDAIVVKEDDEEIRFEPERDENGKFKTRQGQSLLYVDDRGRVMSEATLGRLSVFKWGLFLANVELNVCHLLLWFGCVWLLLRFQWSHALGLAIVFWLAMTLVILPMIFGKVEEAARQSSLGTASMTPNPRRTCSVTGGLQDVHDIAVLHDVGLPLEPIHTVSLGFFHAAQRGGSRRKRRPLP